MADPYENLANAIILQAVKDWREAKGKLRRKPRNENAKLMVEDCEAFFLSDWFRTLTNVDGEVLLTKLQEEFKNDSKRISSPGLPPRS